MRRTPATTSHSPASGSTQLGHCPADRPAHTFAAGHLRTPAERLHALRIQPDARHVAGPSALATAVLELYALRIAAHRLDRPQRDLIDRRGIGHSEVVAIDHLAGALVTEHHSVEAVLDVNIRLRLPAVAEDLKPRWILFQFQDEVVDDAVRRKRAGDVAEAIDPAADRVIVRERGDQRLRGDFA